MGASRVQMLELSKKICHSLRRMQTKFTNKENILVILEDT
jgi:hypothetical protein